MKVKPLVGVDHLQADFGTVMEELCVLDPTSQAPKRSVRPAAADVAGAFSPVAPSGPAGDG